MTCILSMPALYTSAFSEGGADIQNKGCECFDFNWINSQYPHPGLSYNQRLVNQCHTESSKSTSILNGREGISNGVSGTLKQEQYHVHTDDGYENDPDEKGSSNGKNSVTNLFNVNNKKGVEPHHISLKSHAVKRKANIKESEEVYIPSKRVSTFLNTPKQRKDERKKLLKISMKKLKQIDDSEAFLRRTVLVNNITKRLQTELRQEKLSTNNSASNKRNSFRCHSLPNNNCMSDTYLIDDPFLSGVHEKITDDMTDTLIKNVFHDKTYAKTKDSQIDEKSNITSNEMDFSDEQPFIDSRIFSTSSNISQDNSDRISCNGITTDIQSSDRGSHWNCLCNRIDTHGMFFDRFELEAANICNVNTCAGNFKTICHHSSGTLNVGENYSKSYTIENRTFSFSSSELENADSYQNTECDELQSTNLVNLEKSV